MAPGSLTCWTIGCGRLLHRNHGDWSATIGGIVGLLAYGQGVGLLPEGLAQTMCRRKVLQELSSAVPLGRLDYALHTRRDDLRPLVTELRSQAVQNANFAEAAGFF